MTDRLAVDVWSDIVCPWCVIGYANFARAAQMLEGEIALDIRFMPFELNPDMPPQGKPQAQHLREHYGKTEAEAAAMVARMHDLAAKAGFPIAYTGPARADGTPPEAMLRNTREAHKLLRWALAAHGPTVQIRLKEALFRAHWNTQADIASRAVLAQIAGEAGLDRAAAAAALGDEALGIAVEMEERRAAENGITAVPTFVVNQRYILQGSQEPEGFYSALIRLASMEAMG